MQSFCRLRHQTVLLVRSVNIDDESSEVRRQPVHGTGAAPICESSEHAASAQFAVLEIELVGPNGADHGVGEIHRPVIGTPAESIGADETCGHPMHRPVWIHSVKTTCRSSATIVHCPRPQASPPIHFAI